MSHAKSNPLLLAALWYARRGWPVFPVHPKDKVPLSTLAPHGHNEVVCDEEVIHRSWTTYPMANVAVRTGLVSGVVVLDVDPRHGGEDSLDLIQQRYGRTPGPVESLTGGGGRTLFKPPGDPFRVRNTAKLAGLSGLDIRGDGGYVIVPPSLHASRRGYAWEVSSIPDEVQLRSPPQMVPNLITSIVLLSRLTPHPVAKWLEVVRTTQRLERAIQSRSDDGASTALSSPSLARLRAHADVE